MKFRLLDRCSGFQTCSTFCLISFLRDRPADHAPFFSFSKIFLIIFGYVTNQMLVAFALACKFGADFLILPMLLFTQVETSDLLLLRQLGPFPPDEFFQPPKKNYDDKGLLNQVILKARESISALFESPESFHLLHAPVFAI